MPIPEIYLNQIKCCLNNDGHIVNEPILLNCGANACKKCVIDSTDDILRCFNCNYSHDKNDLLNAPINKLAESVIHVHSNDLVQYLNESLESNILFIKSKNY
jgi:hypothetical protein